MQEFAALPFLHVQGDAFLDMVPTRFWGSEDGIVFTQQESDGIAEIEIRLGPQLDRVWDGMRASVAALAVAGNNCIVDDVMLSAENQSVYRQACKGMNLQFVGLHAPLEVLQKREIARGDRLQGLAKWQFERVHTGMHYDFEIDTSRDSPNEIAIAILDALGIDRIR
jgi:chloramphenicol 3-O phosphotransferase